MKDMVPQHPDKEGRAYLMARASQESCTPQASRGEEGKQGNQLSIAGCTVRCRHIFNTAQAGGLEQLPN